ncbi:MAG TPA: ATP synthase F0 subunit C [Candidatus Wallbacteria bacterium]|nr:MAG: ATP synthase subunit c [bacterium ADurb.Bin243]HOD40643.1 ATP synthase F0 subunit C [Candidatus Wallbacteria bacterium]HOT78167.1 ATP synthase F0 subunit C [Candidatus Wallbacteria bacterium]
MNLQLDLHVWSVIFSSLCIAIGAFGAALAQGKSIVAALEGIARQPQSAGEIRTTMIIGLALIESLAIYCLVISLILLFVRW